MSDGDSPPGQMEKAMHGSRKIQALENILSVYDGRSQLLPS